MLLVFGNFWEKLIEIGNMIDVGVCSGFVVSWYVVLIMVCQVREGCGCGLVVFILVLGVVYYCFGLVYGVYKVGVDKMVFDMVVDFKDVGVDVVVVLIWMGLLVIEWLLGMIEVEFEKFCYIEGMFEWFEYIGYVLWSLFCDFEMMVCSGQILIGVEFGCVYGFKDLGDKFLFLVCDMYQVVLV